MSNKTFTLADPSQIVKFEKACIAPITSWLVCGCDRCRAIRTAYLEAEEKTTGYVTITGIVNYPSNK
jgi:hypothetical protein